MNKEEQEIYNELICLLHSIRKGDTKYYQEHTAENMTCFEPESSGLQIRGRQFHDFFMSRIDDKMEYNFEIIDPTVQVWGDTAYIAYNLVTQNFDNGQFKLSKFSETRIFRKVSGKWIMIHFHRS